MELSSRGVFASFEALALEALTDTRSAAQQNVDTSPAACRDARTGGEALLF